MCVHVVFSDHSVIQHVLSTPADFLFPMELIKVLKALEPVVGEWYMLGLHLGLSVNMVKTIEKDYPTIALRKMNMVQRWMSGPQLCPSWCSLVKALCKVGLNTAAGEISKEYSKCSVTSSRMSMVCSCEKRYQAISQCSVLQATECWAGPGNEDRYGILKRVLLIAEHSKAW